MPLQSAGLMVRPLEVRQTCVSLGVHKSRSLERVQSVNAELLKKKKTKMQNEFIKLYQKWFVNCGLHSVTAAVCAPHNKKWSLASEKLAGVSVRRFVWDAGDVRSVCLRNIKEFLIFRSILLDPF